MAVEQQNRRISPAERNARFAMATRQNWQMLPAISGELNSTISFNLPKVRYLSKVRLLVEAVITATHASATTYTPAPFAPFSLLRKVSMDINNGFSPFKLSGKELYLYSLIRNNAGVYDVKNSGRGRVVQGVAAGPGGVANTVRFVADLPVNVNDRDPIGMILLQNEETVVTVTVDFADLDGLAPATSGYTFDVSNIKVTPMVETFSLPVARDAQPDISVLKLVHSTTQTISGSGVQTLALPVGNTYRKLALYIEDDSGVGVADADIAGNFELVLNQADIPYNIKPSVLAAINQEQFDTILPQGLYVFDFSYQGLSGYGGSRDFIDTERLTEFWFRFNASAAGKITAIYETLSRLRTR